MIEFGFSDEEIESFILFVLGDDNTGFCQIDIFRLVKFITFLENYALRRYNMTLSKTKSVITSLRSKIESLGYRCNFGNPSRDIGKLVAQLCYPEHKMKYRTMSARAIGIAYASSGQDSKFHSFCHDVYTMFSVFYDPNPRDLLDMRRHIFHDLPEGTPTFDDKTLPPFPNIHHIRRLVSTYAGPLAYTPKWNIAHFINMPDVIPHTENVPTTMHQYELTHSISVSNAPTFLSG